MYIFRAYQSTCIGAPCDPPSRPDSKFGIAKPLRATILFQDPRSALNLGSSGVAPRRPPAATPAIRRLWAPRLERGEPAPWVLLLHRQSVWLLVGGLRCKTFQQRREIVVSFHPSWFCLKRWKPYNRRELSTVPDRRSGFRPGSRIWSAAIMEAR